MMEGGREGGSEQPLMDRLTAGQDALEGFFTSETRRRAHETDVHLVF